MNLPSATNPHQGRNLPDGSPLPFFKIWESNHNWAGWRQIVKYAWTTECRQLCQMVEDSEHSEQFRHGLSIDLSPNDKNKTLLPAVIYINAMLEIRAPKVPGLSYQCIRIG